jgi:hypothetical protein
MHGNTASRLSHWFDVAVLAAEIQQRLSIPHHDLFHFRDEDGVVTCGLRRV